MTALYLERYLNFGLTPGGAALRQADHRHRADRLRPLALQPAPPRARRARARGHPRRRAASRSSFRCHPIQETGKRPTAGARPQPRLSRPRRGALRLSARRRRADDRLRQDHAGLPDGGGDGEHSGHRALRSGRCSTAGRRASARGSGTIVWKAREDARRRRDRLAGVHRPRRGLGAVDRPLQHDGHGLDDERAGRSARHVAARLRRDPGALPRARQDAPTRPACASSRWCARTSSPPTS